MLPHALALAVQRRQRLRRPEGDEHRKRHRHETREVVLVDVGAGRSTPAERIVEGEDRIPAGSHLHDAQERFTHCHHHEHQRERAHLPPGESQHDHEHREAGDQREPRVFRSARVDRHWAPGAASSGDVEHAPVGRAAREREPPRGGHRNQLQERHPHEDGEAPAERRRKAAPESGLRLRPGERGEAEEARALEEQQRHRPVAAAHQRREDEDRGDDPKKNGARGPCSVCGRFAIRLRRQLGLAVVLVRESMRMPSAAAPKAPTMIPGMIVAPAAATTMP